jgi:holin-like protein
MGKIALFIVQAAFLWLLYWLGNKITLLLNLPIPGNVMGMVLLFGLLAGGIVRTEHIQVASGFLLKHLAFFFIPIAVGLMNWWDLFARHSLVLTLAVVISAVSALVSVALIAQLAGRSGK